MVGMLSVLTGTWAHKCVLAYTLNSVANFRSIILNKSLKISNLVHRLRCACQSRRLKHILYKGLLSRLARTNHGLHRSHFQKTTQSHKNPKKESQFVFLLGLCPHPPSPSQNFSPAPSPRRWPAWRPTLPKHWISVRMAAGLAGARGPGSRSTRWSASSTKRSVLQEAAR